MTRKPLVQVDGQLSELPATDSLSMATPALPVVVMTPAQVVALGGVVTLTASNFPDTLLVPAGPCEIYLPPVAEVTGRQLSIVFYSTGVVDSAPVVYADAADNFEGNTNYTGLALNGVGAVLLIVSDGTTWRVLSHDIPLGHGSYRYYDYVSTTAGVLTLPSAQLNQYSLIDASTGGIDITLPPATLVSGRSLSFLRADSEAANQVILTTTGSDMLDKVTNGTLTLPVGVTVTLLALGGEWVTINKYNPAQAAGQQQVYVQPNDPGLAAGVPGLWIQTGLGADGTGFTFWFNT